MVKTKIKKSKPNKHTNIKKNGKQSDISEFRAQLDALGLKIVEVTADGNCFFRALADQLEGDEDKHEAYRKMVVHYIMKNRENFEPFIEDDVPFDEYCQSMGKDGTWAGNMELQAASLVTHSNICIHRKSSPRWYIKNFNDHDAQMIHLSYHDWEHYNSVRLKEDTCNGPTRPIIIKADADLSVKSHQVNAAVAKAKGSSGKTDIPPESIKIVKVGSGCENEEQIQQIHESIEYTIIPDDILRNILSRLSAKPLMRFRCASKHWNSLITDPYFINSRSHRMILMPSGLTRLYAFDPKHQKIVKLTYPFEHQIYKCIVIGTLNGILLLVLETYFYGPRIFILYNPLTRATEKLPDLPRPCCNWDVIRCAYGFGHGNIITIKYPCDCPSDSGYNYCNVFSLKKGSWTVQKTTFTCHDFVHKVGMFLNGFLHWIAFGDHDLLDIVVLDVTEMVATRMDAPRLTIDWYNRHTSVLGTLHGCLCMSFMWRNGFDVWVKEHSEWSKQYSFALPFYRYGCPNRLDVSILEDRRILVKDEVSNQIIMCHMFERYYDIFKCASEIRVTNRIEYDEMRFTHAVGKPFEYVENLVSPSDICHVS